MNLFEIHANNQEIRIESELQTFLIRSKRINAELHVFRQVASQFLHPECNVIPIHRSCEIRSLEFLLDTLGGKIRDPTGPHLAAGHDETSEFVNGKQIASHGGIAGCSGIGGMSKNGIQDFIIHIASFLKMCQTHEGMFLFSWMSLIVEVMKKAADDPSVNLIRLHGQGCCFHAGRNTLHVVSQGFALNPFMHQLTCSLNIHGDQSSGLKKTGMRQSAWHRSSL